MPIRLVLRLAADSREPINGLIEPYTRFVFSHGMPPPISITGESEEAIKFQGRDLRTCRHALMNLIKDFAAMRQARLRNPLCWAKLGPRCGVDLGQTGLYGYAGSSFQVPDCQLQSSRDR